MSDVIDLWSRKSTRKKEEEPKNEDLLTTIEQNKEKKERVERERQLNNKTVLSIYGIRGRGK